jgi:hypothetical protein
MMRASSSLGLRPKPGPFVQALQKLAERQRRELKNQENIREPL